MSSYCKDKPDELALALRSIWDEQTLKPNEIIIVKDGQLTAELDAVIEDFARNAPVKTVPLPQNRGLGLALAEGITHCTYDLIARMDGDDISLPDRFEKQVAFMKENPDITISGGQIQEFTETPENITGSREVPISDPEIKQLSKWRSPFNHVTVIFRKNAVVAAGNYQHFRYYEDYWLWVRMINNGNKTANLPEFLVKVRAGDNMIQRRRGWKFFKSEIRLAGEFRKLGYISTARMLWNIAARGTARLMPGWLLQNVYTKFCRKRKNIT